MLTSIGLASFAFGAYLGSKNENLSLDDIASLDPNKVNRFDRFSTRTYSPTADRISDLFLLATLASPHLLLWKKECRQNFLPIFITGSETALFSLGIAAMTKNGFQRIRPFVYNDEAPMKEKLKRNARQSFLSGHSLIAASASVFTAQVLLPYITSKSLKKWTLVAAVVLPVAVGSLRVLAGRHYISDVFPSLLIGAAIGYYIPKMHQKSRVQTQVGFNTLGLRIKL